MHKVGEPIWGWGSGVDTRKACRPRHRPLTLDTQFLKPPLCLSRIKTAEKPQSFHLGGQKGPQ